MRDRILAAHLKDFVEVFGLSDLDEATAFERFVNYYVISTLHVDDFDLDEVSVGGFGDLGIDGIGILVNDHLAFAHSTVDHLKKDFRRLDVQFVFIQAKRSSRFEAAGIGTFFSGVRRFFEMSSPTSASDQIRHFFDVKEHIFDSSRDMERSPTCRLYYATTGDWSEDSELRVRIDQGKGDLQRTRLFSNIEFVPLDADGLKRLRRELHGKINREINFEKHVILPQMEDVPASYIGIVPCLEYLKLICDDEEGRGSLNRRLFYDNVRDFQGHNPVNREIEETLQDAGQSDRFVLLNNGITIVAREVNPVGTRFRLSDYQIVNGCQTSHIIHRNRQSLSENICLPLKLIVTDDSEITNQIIKGTNRQTEVKLEAFESLSDFQKGLEEFYQAVGPELQESLYYERRSKQYEHLNIRRDQIVTLPTQIKCFVAMFLNEPHSTHRYYGELLRSYRRRIFSDSHSFFPYFVSGMAHSTLERLRTANRLPRGWGKYKYQMLMVFRIQNEPSKLPHLNRKDIEKYCQTLRDVLDQESSGEEAFRSAGELVQKTLRSVQRGRESPERTRVFTEALIKAAGHADGSAATTARLRGITTRWLNERGYGFIRGDDGHDYFIHHTGIIDQDYPSLWVGDKVEFSILRTIKGRQAVDAEIVS